MKICHHFCKTFSDSAELLLAPVDLVKYFMTFFIITFFYLFGTVLFTNCFVVLLSVKIFHKTKKKPLWPLFCGWCSTVSRLQSHYKETVYFLPFISQEFLVLIWSIYEVWKAELSLEPPGGFEYGAPELGIQRFELLL